MALHFIGIDPDSEDRASPTVWIERSKREFVFQGLKPDPYLEEECAHFQVPGHAAGIPEGEAVIRIPARMVHLIREACDAVERTEPTDI